MRANYSLSPEMGDQSEAWNHQEGRERDAVEDTKDGNNAEHRRSK